MPYIEMMESGLRQVVRAGEEGRRSVDGMLAPITGAVSDLTGAADELSTLPGFQAGLGARALRLTRSLGVAQAIPTAVLPVRYLGSISGMERCPTPCRRLPGRSGGSPALPVPSWPTSSRPACVRA